MAKITPRKDNSTVTVKTMGDKKPARPCEWWKADTKKELGEQLLSTASFLKEQNQYKYRQAAVYARLYGNMPLYGWVGSSLQRIGGTNQLPMDRPTMSVITSCVDTLVSRLTQSKPRPVFLTDNGDSSQRKLAKQMNTFIGGELYNTNAHRLGTAVLRDAAVLGTGVMKVMKMDGRVHLERKLFTEILTDPNDAFAGDPRQMYELKLVDRDVLISLFPEYASKIEKAENAYPDTESKSGRTVSDQVMVVEGWRLPSGKGKKDGRHTIACSEGVLHDEEYTKGRFPFVFLHYSPRMVGFWGQGLAEQIMGTQVEINKLLMTISASINLVGVPRVFVEKGSKVVKAHLNNNVGAIVEYSGTPPSYQIAPCVPAELYQQLQRLVDYAYQQSGISQLSAASQKPQGLNSGVALREYNDLQSDRFAALSRRYDEMYIDLAYQIVDTAKDIAEEDGKYSTVYPSKIGTQEVDLPNADLLNDSYVIQCYDVSSLPKEPAGRLQKVTEMMQAGIVSPQEGRRLLDYPDIEQVDRLANAAEERILQVLDGIVEDGTYTPPDPFMNLMLAEELVTQYYNLYVGAKLPPKRAQMLRTFFTQLQTIKMQASAAMPQPQPPMGGAQGVPEARPVSDIMPNIPMGQ